MRIYIDISSKNISSRSSSYDSRSTKSLAIAMGKDGPIDLPESISNVRTSKELLESGHFVKRGNIYQVVVTFDEYIQDSDDSNTEETPTQLKSRTETESSTEKKVKTEKKAKGNKKVKTEPIPAASADEEPRFIPPSSPLAVRRKRGSSVVSEIETELMVYEEDPPFEDSPPYNLRSRGKISLAACRYISCILN